ncbi:hypothetical protein KEM52_005332 [Ascosphaera acerosa]|nr:hypothetical protein KEM52_005332 [Ascosphaera acerosa]
MAMAGRADGDMVTKRVDDVMADVVTQLKLIADHFQHHDFEALAIHLYRHAREITAEFTHAMWNAPRGASMMRVPRSMHKGCGTPLASPPVTTSLLDLGLDAACAEEEQNHEAEPACGRPGTTSLTPSGHETPTLGPVWEVSHRHPAAQPQTRTFSTSSSNQTPPTSRGSEARSLTPQQGTRAEPSPPASPADHASVASVKTPTFEPRKKAGLVRLSGPFETAEYNDVTGQIHVGPLYDITFHRAIGYAEITFLHIEHAEEFLAKDAASRQEKDCGILGPGYQIEQLDELEWTQGHHDMYDERQRRRVTFVGAGLLTRVTEAKFMNDLMAVAKEDRIDFAWPFNSGNITAVFKSVDVAKHVVRHFTMLASKPMSPYFRTIISFSSDPCEKPLSLLTRYTPKQPGKVISLNNKQTRPQYFSKRPRMPYVPAYGLARQRCGQ